MKNKKAEILPDQIIHELFDAADEFFKKNSNPEIDEISWDCSSNVCEILSEWELDKARDLLREMWHEF